MRTAPICTIDCSDYIYRATKLEARARESHTYADVAQDEELSCQAVSERKFARRLQADAEALWDHMYDFHPEETKEYFEDLHSY